MENRDDLKYAGFFTRLLVVIVDIFVISLLVSIINMLVSIAATPILVPLIWWLYTATMQSKWQTTVGGKIFGIKVLDISLSKLSFFKASIRFIASIAPFLLYAYLRGIQHGMILPPSPTLQMLPQLIFILLPFVMYASKKRQMLHDILVKSIVIDVNRATQKDDTMGERIVPIGQKILRVIGTLLFLMIFGYVAVYTYVFYTLGKHSSNNYNASFHTVYQTNDYNDTKIIYYQKELEKYSKEFIEAERMYDIFAADTKKDLALNCIQVSLKEHNVSDWIQVGSNFRKNARNKYANTEDKIKKAKKNSNYMSKHFYTFDLNMVNHIEDDITKTWSDKNESVCEKKLSTDDMYKMFIEKYISKFESENIHSQFGSTPQQREIDWFEILMKTHPKYLEKKKEEERVFQIQYQEMKDKEEKEKEKARKVNRDRKNKLYQDTLKRSKQPIFVTIRFNKNDDFDELMIPGSNLEMKNEQGYTLLRAAIFYKNEYVINRLIESGANMYAMDKHNGYSPFTWAAGHNDMKSVKLFLNNGVDVNHQYKKSETALTMAAKGCKNFEMVELLLDNGADPKIMDTYNQNTLTGLSRYCRDKKKYEKMKNLIEKKSSFFLGSF